MADPRGFMKTDRQSATRRPVEERVQDWHEVYPGSPGRALLPIISEQAGRCMDCGIPFCHTGCPLGNLIPEWNDLVWRGDWDAALERLHATNNFPEFTGRLCPAPCEDACVVAIADDAVTIKNVEVSIIDKGWDTGKVRPQVTEWHTGSTVAVIGSGPAGLAAAQQLTRAGHTVAVLERDDKPGGLLRYGIPEYKMEKSVLERRLDQMREEGTHFKCGVEVGKDISGPSLRGRFDAVIVATGATVPRKLEVPGADLNGVHDAMDYLTQANRVAVGEQVTDQISAAGKNVVIIGGGDTGNDCLGTAIRQGAKSILQLEHNVEPPTRRAEHEPWPTYPRILRVSPANEEGGERIFKAATIEVSGDDAGNATGIKIVEVVRENGVNTAVEGTEQFLAADLVLLAMGYTGPEADLLEQLGVPTDSRTRAVRNNDYSTSVDGVFVAGDAGRGQSLIVWAIAEGRACAATVDKYLSGSSKLPRPVLADAQPIGR
ncbi:glutamate synthase subunit beta [Microlunatus soli]|uniref:Glutamate synthase (NADPH/NADH) small chain n=1 Tax=Microlunatus soli TaxID=630515 RepID=A0A1H2A463_9ACTN|nr:glutamate synthase subunit beta [Microlunatus soli]SDT40768.1 glutamate synthase (NADPH/NADH) small chain [Microlunatus soli]